MPEVATGMSLEVSPLLVAMAVPIVVMTMRVAEMDTNLDVAGLHRRGGADACKSDTGHECETVDKDFFTHAIPPHKAIELKYRHVRSAYLNQG